MGVLLLGWVSTSRADLTTGLVAYYPFDGNASDMSGNGHHGTVNGAVLTADRHGESGKAYDFDGVDDDIVTTNMTGLNFGATENFTITAFKNNI